MAGGAVSLYERDSALGEVESAVASARHARTTVSFIVAEAGLGKTALLGQCPSFASEFRILAAEGTAADTTLPFGYLTQVLSQLGGTDAWATIPGLGSSDARAKLYYESLATLLHAASEGPVLLALDDLHWADQDSIDLLRFLCYRAPEVPVAVVAALRPWPTTAMGVVQDLVSREKARTIALEPLTQASAVKVLSRSAGRALSETELRTAVDACAGNPLLLRFLGQRLGDATAGVVVRIDTAELLIAQFGALSGDALRFSQAASVMGTRFVPEIGRVVAGMRHDEVSAAMTELTKAGLVNELRDGQAEFVHPLFAEALYGDLVAYQRADLHRRTMEAMLEAGADIAQAARHARQGKLFGNATAIAVLEEAGHGALASGALEAALANLRTATDYAGRHASAALRLTLAAAEVDGGSPEAAEELCRPLTTESDSAVRLEAYTILTGAAIAAWRPDLAEERFEKAMQAAGADLRSCTSLLLRTETSLSVLSPPSKRISWASHVRRLAADAGSSDRVALDVTWGLMAALCGDPGSVHMLDVASRGAFGGLLDSLPTPDAGWIALNAMHIAIMAERFDDARAAFDFAWDIANQVHVPLLMMHVAVAYSDALVRQGRLADSLTLVDEVDRATEAIPGFVSYTYLPRAYIALECGDPEAAGAVANAMREALDPWPHHYPLVRLWVLKIAGELALDDGRLADASDLADSMVELARSAQLDQPCVVPWADTALTSYLRAGRLSEAEELIGYLEHVSTGWPCRWPRSVAASGRGALAEHQSDLVLAEHHLRSAVDLLDEDEMPLACASALIDLGRFLRRNGRPSECREPLRRAASAAGRCGAIRLERKASTELAASGGRRSRGRTAELTPRQREIAELAVQGLSDAEIAAKLVVSVRTVEHHLQAVYRKTGARSRRELSPAALGVGPSAPAGRRGRVSRVEVSGLEPPTSTLRT